MKRGGATVYFELDLAGNVRRLRGDAGIDHGGYRYTAFGTTIADDALVVQPLRWKARWWQSLGANELYDVRARQWSPELGSFLSIDEYAFANSTTTLWGWPGQSPVRWSDPDGRCGAACVGAVVGGVIGGLSYAATAPTSMSWGDFAVGAAGAIGGGAAVGALAGVSPQAGFIAIGALGVASDKDLWKLGLAAPLATAGGGASCPTRDAPASSPVGRRASPINVPRGTNAPATIGGRTYTGHALDQMQARGITPSVVEDTLARGAASSGYDGATVHATDQARVVVNPDGTIKTVMPFSP